VFPFNDDSNNNDYVIKTISSALGLSEDDIKLIHKTYNSKINGHMEGQYLAHVIRAVEQFVAEERGKKSFRVICKAVDGQTGIYLDYSDHPNVPKGEERFIIGYPKSYDSRQIRMCVAHELGHLFFGIEQRKGMFPNDIKTMEAVANVFGLLLIFGRNALYTKKKEPFQDISWQNLIREYAALCKQSS
jgi:hypothetical protein